MTTFVMFNDVPFPAVEAREGFLFENLWQFQNNCLYLQHENEKTIHEYWAAGT